MADAVRWQSGKLERFKEYISYEIQRALDGRQSLERQWLSWLTAYRAPSGQLKSFPWEGASNETLPAIAIDVNQLYAKFLQTLHAAPNLWSVSPLNERWVKVAKPMQDFLELVDTSILQMYNVNKRVVLETCKLGTGIYKVGWTFEQRRVQVYNELGKLVPAMKTRSLPFVDHVRLFDLILPPESYNLDPDKQGGAPWCAERVRLSPDRLRMLAKSSAPDLPNISADDLETILRFEEATQTSYDDKVQRQDYQRRFNNEKPIETPGTNEVLTASSGSPPVRQIELWEVHVRFPAQSDQVYDDLVVLWHQPTRRAIRTTLNPYSHGQRPYEVIRYFPGEGFYGIGVAEQKEMFQRVLSNLANYTVDGALLSNAIMMGAKAGANILPGEPIYPSKVWITDGNPKDELFPIQMGGLNASLQGILQLFQSYGERATGVSDLQLGNVNDLPGRTPATTIVSMLQEGNRRPDLTIKDMRYEGLSRVGLRLVQLFQQYLSKPVEVGQTRMLQIMMESLGEPEGSALASKLTTPMESAELGLGVNLSATSGSTNKEVDKQNILALLQLAGQVGPQVMQYMQVALQAQGTPLAQVAEGAARGTTELFRRALEQYDIRDPESILPSSAAPSEQPPVPGPGGTGMPGPGGPLLSPGLEALGAGGGGNGVPAGAGAALGLA